MLSSSRAFQRVCLGFGLNALVSYFLFQYIQPQCEPCLPGNSCPPCVSKAQYMLVGTAGIIAVLLAVQLLRLLRPR